MTRITILGDGAMGTAAAMILAQKPDLDVSLWCQFDENKDAIVRDRENRRFLPGVHVPESIRVVSDFSLVRQSDAFLLAIPMVYLRGTLTRLAGDWPRDSQPIVVSVVKGIEQGTFCRASQIAKEVLQIERFVPFSGPTHAEEIARGKPAGIVAAHSDVALAETVQRWFANDRLRVYTSRDVIGTELGGALKNVIAIAAGICDGAEFGDNAKSALMTRGLVEMTRFGVAMGAQATTFQGLAGLGDLITTCVSPHGRNRRVGERLGRGETIDQILGDMQQVAEGVWTARGVHELAQSRNIEMPVTQEVHRILFEGKNVRQAVEDLMNRPLTQE